MLMFSNAFYGLGMVFVVGGSFYDINAREFWTAQEFGLAKRTSLRRKISYFKHLDNEGLR